MKFDFEPNVPVSQVCVNVNFFLTCQIVPEEQLHPFLSSVTRKYWCGDIKASEEENRGYIPPNIGSDYSIKQQRSSKYQVDNSETSNDVESECVQARAHQPLKQVTHLDDCFFFCFLNDFLWMCFFQFFISINCNRHSLVTVVALRPVSHISQRLSVDL